MYFFYFFTLFHFIQFRAVAHWKLNNILSVQFDLLHSTQVFIIIMVSDECCSFIHNQILFSSFSYEKIIIAFLPFSFIHTAEFLASVGRHEEACRSRVRAAELSPNNYNLVMAAATSLRWRDRKEDALKWYRQVRRKIVKQMLGCLFWIEVAESMDFNFNMQKFREFYHKQKFKFFGSLNFW